MKKRLPRKIKMPERKEVEIQGRKEVPKNMKEVKIVRIGLKMRLLG
jgi:hypothetical protein